MLAAIKMKSWKFITVITIIVELLYWAEIENEIRRQNGLMSHNLRKWDTILTVYILKALFLVVRLDDHRDYVLSVRYSVSLYFAQ